MKLLNKEMRKTQICGAPLILVEHMHGPLVGAKYRLPSKEYSVEKGEGVTSKQRTLANTGARTSRSTSTEMSF